MHIFLFFPKVYSERCIEEVDNLRRVIYRDDHGHKMTLADFKSLQSSMSEDEDDAMKQYYSGRDSIFHILAADRWGKSKREENWCNSFQLSTDNSPPSIRWWTP